MRCKLKPPGFHTDPATVDRTCGGRPKARCVGTAGPSPHSGAEGYFGAMSTRSPIRVCGVFAVSVHAVKPCGSVSVTVKPGPLS